MIHADIDEVVRSSEAGRRLSERAPLAADVHGVLVDMIMNHHAEAGGRLNIDALARSLRVSPTPVREALARMEAEGLVTKEPNRGYAVAPLIGLDDLRAMMDFRLLIEPAAAAEAARRADATEATALRAFARTGGAGNYDATANRLDMVYDATFHDTIARLSGNRWLREALAHLRCHLHMYRLYHHAQQAAATKPEHVAIAKAIGSKDPEAAGEAMRTHLQTAMRRLDRVFASRKATLAREG